ncbi:MAG: TIGR03435 family protein [Vicinamibacterales bacterium]
MPRGFLTVAVIIWSVAPASAQQPPAGAAAPSAFEAASIRPSGGGAIDFRFFPNRFVGTNLTLGQLIEQAYSIQPRELIGGPDWVRVERFNVTATSGAEVGLEQMRLMLRSLLADRFQLRIDRETRTGTVYRLIARNVQNVNPPAKSDERPLVTNGRYDQNGFVSYDFTGHNATMGQLAVVLGGHLSAPVTDETGLKGSYDFRVRWTHDNPIGGIPPDPNIPTIFTAIERDLGLKLEAGKGPVPVHVIRSVARPSPN